MRKPLVDWQVQAFPLCLSLLAILVLIVVQPVMAKINPFDSSETTQLTQQKALNAKELVLNPEKLDQLLHNVVILSLLKAKTRSLLMLPNFPREEAVLYSRCAAEASTAVKLAKCIVPLLNARDELNRWTEEEGQGERRKPAEIVAEMDWPTRFGRWLLQGLGKLGFGQSADKKKENEEAKIKLYMKESAGKRRRRIRHRSSSGKQKPLKETKKTIKDGFIPVKSKLERNRHLRIRHLPPRAKRAAVKVDPVEFLKRIFQPNARQAKRAEMSRAKRMGQDVASKQPPMDLFKGKNVPWYMQPLGQLLRLAKGLLNGKKLSEIGRNMKKKRRSKDKRRRMEEAGREDGEGRTSGRKRRRRQILGGNEDGSDKEEDGRSKFGSSDESVEKKGVVKRNRRSPVTTKKMDNIAKLQRIQHFYEMFERCERHLSEMGDENARFLGQLDPAGGANLSPLLSRMGRSQFDSLAQELQQVLSNYSFHSFPILSPRLLSLFPAEKSTEPSLLSPTLFSFQPEGLFSLPTLFGLVSTSEGEMLDLLDLFMELAGASKVLDKILAEVVEPRMEAVERKLYPTVLRLEQMERRWEAVRGSLSNEQIAALDRWGYALMDKGQFTRLYGRKKAAHWGLTDEQQLEEDIRRMAQMHDDGQGRSRSKRQSEGNATENNEEDIRSLRPFLFTNKLRQQAAVAVNGAILSPSAFATNLMNPNFMQLNVLSPIAFIPAILSPRAMVLTVLSPTAFTANILTPNTLWTEVLSPKFFHSNVLSPRALASLILSPRTMLGEVLSPKLIEFRVLNPGTFFAGVLTPNVLMPRVLSPSNFGVTVLSPNILSPSILSKGNFTVQVLSPSIMSDDVTAEQFWRGEWQKEKTNTTAF